MRLTGESIDCADNPERERRGTLVLLLQSVYFSQWTLFSQMHAVVAEEPHDGIVGVPWPVTHQGRWPLCSST